MKLAIDIGTTTVGMCLFDDNIKKYVNIENPNRLHGADVISRMKNAVHQNLGEKIRQDLRNAILTEFDNLAEGLDLSFRDLECVVISANVAMTHLFMGLDLSGMLDAPFTPQSLEMIFDEWDSVPVTVFGGLSPFVGGDIVSGLYALDLFSPSKPELLIDLGTNGEIVLCLPDSIIATSTAAGPAFEGANISCGVAATYGAIDSVRIQNGFCRISTIGNELPPKGLCGSGLIDAVYELYHDGIIDRHGTFVTDENRSLGFTLYHDNFSNNDIRLKQDDIRNLQTAKAAICAGIMSICRQADISYEDIAKVHIAGSFGKHLDVEKAFGIGLLPAELKNRAFACGNTSLQGAILLASNPSDAEIIKKKASRSTCINLADSSAFGDAYISSMDFAD